MASALQYATWTTVMDLGFYSALAKLKIDHDRLDSSARKVVGLYEVRPRDEPDRSTTMHLHTNALTSDDVPAGFCRAEGMIRNFNTFEDFKDYDRAIHMDRAGRTLWDAINDGTIYECPALLSSFSAIFFANLKKYTFQYHFAYPALHSDPQWKQAANSTPAKLSANDTLALVDKYQTWRYSVDTRQRGFFLAKTQRDGDGNLSWTISTLASFDTGFFANVPGENQYIGFVDPSTYPQGPGWMLRNLLVLVRQRFRLSKVRVLCYRDTHARREHPTSIILDLQCGDGVEIQPAGQFPKVTGWERNDRGKIGTRTMDLAENLDPTRLADQAVDLNLKLIKWRIAPSIDLDVIKNTKCLLLGAGTLGSYVARNLMGWGVRKITFIDNAKVSFSNPVRQPLYTFSDCLDGGVRKAERAAASLREIYPGVDSQGLVMSVPMAGHPITDEAATKKDYDKLYELIQSHDAIFLLMDTRESRWLPTVMAKSMSKIVINAALGFDTYMVMRHGVRTRRKARTSSSSSGLPVSRHTAAALTKPPDPALDSSAASLPGPPAELGCYFCSDVVAPKDSLRAATLDQQCTVTRPGVAPVASALAAELLVSVLQSPHKALAPAPAAARDAAAAADDDAHPLGSVPHQLRGFLSTWSTMAVVGRAYDCCSACSPAIVGAFERDGWEFVKRAIGEQGFVEEVSGLAEVQRRAEEVADDVDWDEEDELAEDVDEDGELI